MPLSPPLPASSFHFDSTSFLVTTLSPLHAGAQAGFRPEGAEDRTAEHNRGEEEVIRLMFTHNVGSVSSPLSPFPPSDRLESQCQQLELELEKTPKQKDIERCSSVVGIADVIV